MVFENNIIEGKTIEDVWRDATWCCVRNGYNYKIEKGSYEGQQRRQLEYVVVKIIEPWERPLAVTTPEGSGIPSPTSEESINEYFISYIMGDEVAEGEDYSYGEFITKQIDKIIEILNESNGHSNQATISIGVPSSVYQNDPPCLRCISFKKVNDKLNMTVYFRSWDCYSGMPENLGGLQLLKEYVLANLNFDVDDGEIIAFSDGLHIYEQYFSLVNSLCVDKIKE